uniref:Plasmid replication protein n=1 Tax=uncultured prokaryote TaxID=198431 RepID=A0A0H5Q2X5_9ZZZZ|nr:hypothetical protein [uncultured prokaryote]
MTEKKSIKKRHWAFVAYPESLPKDWIDQLKLSGLKVAISPLHDRDINPTGEPKKPHYHVIISYEGPTTFNNVKGFTDSLNATIPQALEQVQGYYRYLTHEDNPEKAHYSKADIQTLNGFNIRDFVEMTKSEVNRCIREIQQFIMDNDILEYADLLEILLSGGEAMVDWYDVASSHTLLFTAYLRSRRYRAEKKQTVSDGTSEQINTAEEEH